MSLPKIINIQQFDVDSKTCPQALRLVLRAQLRDVFSRRNEYSSCVPSNSGLDALIDQWWLHHRSIIRAASIRPEWDWKTLSLHYNQNVARPVNFYYATQDFLGLIGRPYTDTDLNRLGLSGEGFPIFSATSNYYLGNLHEWLFKLFKETFWDVILEGKNPSIDTVYTDADARLSAERVAVSKEAVSSIPMAPEGKQGSAFSYGLASLLTSGDDVPYIPFNKLPKAIFDKLAFLLATDPDAYSGFYVSLGAYLNEHRDDFRIELLKSIGAHQMAGPVGPVKTTLCNKLVKYFYDWLNGVSYGFCGNKQTSSPSFDDSLAVLKNSYRFATSSPFKVRSERVEGYQLVRYGNFEQMFARLQENVKGSFTRESFIVSFHPCDMITCSLGYNWSSCQSFIDIFDDLPDGYGQGSTYSGMYHRGDFQFLCGNGFIAYIPHEELKGVPQYLWAKKKRCLIWVGDNLDCMRQNFFYPGKPTDQETLALGKVIREYIQDVCAPFNFSNGTMDWKVKRCGDRYAASALDADFERFEERYDPNSGLRYDDPIMALSYLKTASDTPSLYYALNFPQVDSGHVFVGSSGRRTSSLFAFTSNTCPICGKHTAKGGICSTCSKQLVEHNGRMLHPSDLISLNINGKTRLFDLTELEAATDYVVAEDGTAVEFKAAHKVFMPSGIKYFKELPAYVKQCKVCKEWFHPSLMVGDVCIEHFNAALSSGSADDIVVDIDEVLKSFMAKTLSFDCNDTDNLLTLLRLLEKKGVYWVSGKKASEYVPTSVSSKRLYLSLSPQGRLILSAQAKSTVVRVSNLFKKGGEN